MGVKISDSKMTDQYLALEDPLDHQGLDLNHVHELSYSKEECLLLTDPLESFGPQERQGDNTEDPYLGGTKNQGEGEFPLTCGSSHMWTFS